MDIGFYNRGSRGIIKHKTAAAAMPAFYSRSPAVGPAAAPAAAAWPAPAPPPSAVSVEAVSGMYSGGQYGGGGVGVDADVDRRAAMYISRVQERLRRERMVSEEYWRKCY
ncbi:hypothetical protein E2562_015051 [Oryza meyeriana var. granulata]|uniref:Uncharacterized protein n=1 Tax=Oryza meyeriana var. granulata TaxID=110450 RepID=A0A6G1EJK8_9ORYZ|nr:hypothetical protein E2562_015051 [Oryza meyeriana var. granulata]